MKSVLVFFSGSKDAKAGRGTGEYLKPGDDFSELDTVKDWRRVLSNFHVGVFEYDGEVWTCIEEAFQAAKFGRDNYAAFRARVREVQRDYRLDPGSAARSCRKFQILDKTRLGEWDAAKFSVLREISLAKFEQNPAALRVLKLTGDATLLHLVPRSTKKMHFVHLEQVRDLL